MSYSQRSDEELIISFLQGEEEAFVELVHRYSKPLYNLAYRFTGDVGEAEDLVQETFLRVHKSLPASKTDRPLKPWIYRIATNLCINWAKKKRPSTFSRLAVAAPEESVIDKIVDETPLPSELFEQKNLQDILQKAILKLPLKYRSVVILRYTQEFTFEEIADTLDLPIGTVKSRFFRAKTLLRIFLEDQQGFIKFSP